MQAYTGDMKFIKSKFSFSLLLIVSVMGTLLTHAPNVEIVEETPARSTQQVQVGLTPGQKITQRMAYFSVPKLREVMPADLFAKLEEQTASYGGLVILSNLDIEYENRNKWYVFRKVKEIIRGVKEKSDNLHQFYMNLLELFDNAQVTALHRIEFKATEFFQALHPDGKIEIDDKKNGIQLGCIAIVTEPTSKTFKYYVKTHSAGLLQDKTTSAKRFSAIELLVYKVLEAIGVGCKTYFFGRNMFDTYIATLDAGHDCEFIVYEKIKEKLPEDDEECKALLIRNDETRIIACEITKLDLLCRVLRLTDLQTNPSNFGFVQMPDGGKKVKAIDFRTMKLDEDINPEDFANTENSFKALMNGNGSYKYRDSFMRIVLAPDSPIGKMDTLRKVFEEFSLFESMVAEGKLKVLANLPELMGGEAKLIREMKLDIEQVSGIFIENFRLFKRLFLEYHPRVA